MPFLWAKGHYHVVSEPIFYNLHPDTHYLLNVIFQDGTLRNGDHLLAVGDVRLWGMGAEQVASILRQAGQDSIRLVVARPVDPSVPQFAVRIKIIYSFLKNCQN